MTDRSEPTLAAHVENLDAIHFVGRELIRTLVSAARHGANPTRIFHIVGPDGVGKSALLRALARDARADGARIEQIDAPALVTSPEGFDHGVEAGSRLFERPADLVLIDDRTSLQSSQSELRRSLVTTISDSTVVVTADRARPGTTWFDDGLDRVTAELMLHPLAHDDAATLLKSGGVKGYEVERLIGWSLGYPLALVAATSGRPAEDRGILDARGVSDAELARRVLSRLDRGELADIDPLVLAVASIAPVVDARLLAAVLPGRATRGASTALRSCRLVERRGGRVALHALARQAIATTWRDTDPGRWRELTLSTAAHLRDRSLTEGNAMLAELGALIENPAARLGFETSTTHVADHARPDDIRVFVDAVGRPKDGWVGRVTRWMTEYPRQAVTVRQTGGALEAVAVTYTAATLPEWAADTIEVAPVIDHARRHGRFDDAVFLQDVCIVQRPCDETTVAEITRVGNAAVIARCSLTSPRYAYVTATPGSMDALAAVGYETLDELARHDDERTLATWCCDFGPGGMVGRAYAMICAEQGADPLHSSRSPARLVDALRSFRDDATITRTLGADDARAARAVVIAALDATFGDSPSDREARTALELAYVADGGGHLRAQRELHRSRSSYFRLLQRARDRLIDIADPNFGEMAERR